MSENIIDLNLVSNTANRSVTIQQVITPGPAVLLSAANDRKSHVIVQVTSAEDFRLGGTAVNQSLVVSGNAGSIYPNFIELRTRGEVWAIATSIGGTVALMEFFND